MICIPTKTVVYKNDYWLFKSRLFSTTVLYGMDHLIDHFKRILNKEITLACFKFFYINLATVDDLPGDDPPGDDRELTVTIFTEF